VKGHGVKICDNVPENKMQPLQLLMALQKKEIKMKKDRAIMRSLMQFQLLQKNRTMK
jgi:hypothetical protein